MPVILDRERPLVALGARRGQARAIDRQRQPAADAPILRGRLLHHPLGVRPQLGQQLSRVGPQGSVSPWYVVTAMYQTSRRPIATRPRRPSSTSPFRTGHKTARTTTCIGFQPTLPCKARSIKLQSCENHSKAHLKHGFVSAGRNPHAFACCFLPLSSRNHKPDSFLAEAYSVRCQGSLAFFVFSNLRKYQYLPPRSP